MRKLSVLLLSGILTWTVNSVAPYSKLLADEANQKEESKDTKTQPIVEKEDETPKDPAKEQSRAQVYAEHFKVSLSLITELREKKMGWGEISHLLTIAQKSHQTVETILILRLKGMGWGDIARQYNLKLGQFNREIHAVKHEFKKVDRPGKPDHVGRPADRPERNERVNRVENTERPEKVAMSGREDRPEKPVRSR